MTFRLATVAGRAALVDAAGGVHDLERVSGGAFGPDPIDAVARHRELHGVADALDGASAEGHVDETTLGAPVPRPVKAFGIGLNYRAHAEEAGADLPPAPLTFAKFTNCISGPRDDIVLSGETVDYEVELVVVMGDRCRSVAAADAWDRVAGITCGQDISDRTVQMTGRPPQFALGKSFDGYGPIGPVLVSVDAFADPDDVELWCSVSGEERQRSRTSDLIFSVPEIVEYLSSICTLEAGDVIFTGTPSGVGMASGRFLADGDVVETTVAGVGTMVNRCVGA